MRFASRAQFKKAVQLYAIMNGFDIGWKKSEETKMDGRCMNGCEWRVFASWMQSEKTFIIKTVGNEHTCPRSMRNKNATYVWLAEQFLPKIRANLKYTTSQMQADAMEMWALTLNKRTCYRAINRAIEIIRGPFVEQYKLLHSYKAELIRCSPNSTFDLEVGRYNTFKRFYVGFKELKEGFLAGCRRVIGLDGCFTETLIRGMLLCATGRDGNNQMFPIAWAVVEAETEESWTWFLKLLVKDLNVGQGLGWTFMSDQQKGLLNAVSKLSPRAEHRNCARHIYANWKKLYKGETFRNCFWRAAYSTYEADFNIAIKEMKEESVHAYEDFMRQGPEHFCRAFIKCGRNCNAIENNLSETFNAYICRERECPIVDMLEGIRKLLMVRMYEKSQLMIGSRDEICPRIRLKIEEEKMKSRFCIPRPSTASRFEVEVNDDTFMVDLNEKTCTCRQWDISGIPCNHAISCINFIKCNVNDYVAESFKKDAYKRCYQFALPTLNGRKMWPKTSEEPLLPPPFRKLPGRPKKDRKRPNGETKKDEKSKRIRKPRVTNTDPTKISKSGITMKCSNCHGIGHNKTTCPQPSAPLEIKLTGKRGRPRKHPKKPTIEEGASNKQSESTTSGSVRAQSNIVRFEKRRMPGSNIVQKIHQGGANHTVDISSQVFGPSQTQQSQSEARQ
ncbi:uncharacterized protein LOC115675634 isoform X3 [Syzygium oleosum]|uniref:uncharacterized protein LOC115675634 isoform X3 n=1 Tax=Syzygium oleosum TaxID=219896 RepID=UPI0024BB9B3B|nr:uncharacterized protein LOC115675634 isoform X3 [Syzygium oleosum]